MRDRLVAGFVGLAVVCIVVFAISRVVTVLQVVPRDLDDRLERSTELVAAVLAAQEMDGRPVTTQLLAGLVDDREHVSYLSPTGQRLDAGMVVDPELENLVATHPVTGGGEVTITLSGEVLDDAVATRILPLVTVGIALIALAAVVGYLLARRLAGPFRQLAGVADEFARGRFDVEVPHYAIPEADEIGTALREAAAEIQQLVRREREFAANAAHQLRTPITALRLDLEDLTMWPETPTPVAEQLDRAISEVDRLSTTVNDLLDLARGQRLDAVVQINLCAVVADTVERWRPRAEMLGRPIEYDAPGPIAVRLAPGPVSQVLDVLIENAIDHGQGTIGVDVSAPDGYVRVVVRDEGRTSIGNDVFRRSVQSPTSSGEGIGLAVASEIADALGGHLALESAETATFALMLPRPAAPG
jgi:signal transduction histidine kinase